MTDDAESRLDTVKHFYAAMAAAAGGEIRDRLVRAFEFVPREMFLGVGPWSALSLPSGIYVETPDADPIHVYQDALFALDRPKRIHNGEPHLHGQLLGALRPDYGHTVLHVGCGTGYYSAILAHLIGPTGRVVAYELEPALAERAAECLAPWETVEVVAGSGVAAALPKADRIYVSAGATHPAPAWLDALADGGRLVFPLSGHAPYGVYGVSLAVERTGQQFAVTVIGRSGFINCIGATDIAEGGLVMAALNAGALWKAKSLVRDAAPDDSAVLTGKDWWLSSRGVE